MLKIGQVVLDKELLLDRNPTTSTEVCAEFSGVFYFETKTKASQFTQDFPSFQAGQKKQDDEDGPGTLRQGTPSRSKTDSQHRSM